MYCWLFASQLAAKVDRVRSAESRLLQLARQFGYRQADHYEMVPFDTKIPRTVVPLKRHDNDGIYGCSTSNVSEEDKEDPYYIIHGVRVTSKSNQKDAATSVPTEDTPLVLLHGYMNGSSYFYRNLVGLSHTFNDIFSLDLLGWGLSSRPSFDLQESSSREHAEAFFVESLEAWRQQHNLDQMILAGHSMGGYLSVAYAEKYPERVKQLVLLSPVGVPRQNEADMERRQAFAKASWRNRLVFGFYTSMFSTTTVGGVLRMLPAASGRDKAYQYVSKRLPAISDPEEQNALADYLYWSNALPGSGEDVLRHILTPYVFAKHPLVDRIPKLKVNSVTFLYGSSDWMDATGGLQTQLECDVQRQQLQRTSSSSTTTIPPDVRVYQVSNAGHLLMLDNWQEVNNGICLAVNPTFAAAAKNTIMPVLLDPQAMASDDARPSWAIVEQQEQMRHNQQQQSVEVSTS